MVRVQSGRGDVIFNGMKGEGSMVKFASLISCILLIVAAGCQTDSPETVQQASEAAPPDEVSAGAPAEYSSAEQPQTSAGQAPAAKPEETWSPKPAAPATTKPASTPQPAEPAAKAPEKTEVAEVRDVTPAADPAEPPPASAARQPAPAPAPPPVRKPEYATVASGTQLNIRLAEAVDSGVNETGDLFEAILDKDIVVGDAVVAPRGSVVTGEVVDAKGSGRVEGRAKMSLTLMELKVGDTVYPIRCNTLAFEAEGETKKDAAKIGAGAGIGAIIGAIAGGGKGAAIGAAIGGGAGTASVIASKGKEVSFSAEQAFVFSLEQEIVLPLP
jgi:hypothetical protein